MKNEINLKIIFDDNIITKEEILKNIKDIKGVVSIFNNSKDIYIAEKAKIERELWLLHNNIR